jgi:glutamate carboxypeptidase
MLVPAGDDVSTIGFVSHLDTVFSPDEEEQNDFSWRVEGDRIYGPGTVDIKGGTIVIYMILSALKDLFPAVYNRVNWVVLLNAAEETLVPEFGELCRTKLPQDRAACLVFEGGRQRGPRFSLVTARKGRVTFRVRVTGHAAHAGSAHQYGANAVVQMAHSIAKIAAFTDYDRDLTFNVGTASGGTVTNRVPHTSVAAGEMRAFDQDVMDDGLDRLLAVPIDIEVHSAKGGRLCKVDIEILHQWAPWPSNESTESLFDIWRKTADILGVEVVNGPRGGLSDGNFLWDHVPTIDGLGPSGGHSHCSERDLEEGKDQEYVLATSFVPKATLDTMAILELVKRFSSDSDW